MAENDEEVVTAEDVPRPRMSRTTLAVIVLSVVLCMALLAMVAGGIRYAARIKALQAEVVAVKKELNEKAQAHDGMQDQILALSRQVDALKSYAVARSQPSGAEVIEAAVPNGSDKEAASSVHGKEKVAEVAKGPTAAVKAESQKPVAPAVSSSSAAKPESVAVSQPSVPAKAKNSASDGISCDLSGKSAEEQAAILKRCVSVMDAPPPKAKPAGK